MKLIRGNLWEQKSRARIIFFTGNASVKKNGELVMGRGAAKEAEQYFPGLAHEIGQWFTEKDLIEKRVGIYISSRYQNGTFIGYFQVKYRWYDNANLDLIKFSCKELCHCAMEIPEKKIAINFPGIGNGGLDRRDVQPILEDMLPDNVWVYYM